MAGERAAGRRPQPENGRRREGGQGENGQRREGGQDGERAVAGAGNGR